MNRYLTTKESLDILSQKAPRAWCKKLLTCLIFEGSLTPYARGGNLTGRVPILVLLDDDKIAPADSERFWAAVREKYGSGLPRVFEGKTTPRGTLYSITGARWYPDNPDFMLNPIGFGYFFYADRLDWEAGTIYIESLFPNEVRREFFLEDDAMFSDGGYLAQPRFSWLEFEVELTDLCFERSVIEMLTGFEQPQPVSSSYRGRPRKWDWEGALTQLAAEAHRNPDGLPDGYGAQAKLEKMMLEWFLANAGDAPAESEIRLRASSVLTAIEKAGK